MSVAQIMLLCAGACYMVSAGAFISEDKPWMALTMALYAVACVTIYYGGKA